MAMGEDQEANLARAEHLVREAAGKGAQLVLLPELFQSVYFCQEERERYFGWASPQKASPAVALGQRLSRELGVVLPISFFERSGPAYFNSLAMFDADGAMLGTYRKSHIPDGPGYEEKYYFSPGDSGFKVFETQVGRIGVGICWDQWFPECARIMTLKGADLLLYPTAIGSEPDALVATPNTWSMWQRAMVGHAVHNACPVAAANRVGVERVGAGTCTFYGHSFVCDQRGEILDDLGEVREGVLIKAVDLAAAREFRAGMGFFRDRRPELYQSLLTRDGGA